MAGPYSSVYQMYEEQYGHPGYGYTGGAGNAYSGGAGTGYVEPTQATYQSSNTEDFGLDSSTLAQFKANKFLQDEQNKFNEYMYDKNTQVNREFMEKANAYNTTMANTEVQRKVDDMIKAGINPMVFFSQGQASGQAPTSATYNQNPIRSNSTSVTAPDDRRGKASNIFSKIMSFVGAVGFTLAAFL